MRYHDLSGADREYVQERAGMREFDGEQSRADANLGAFGDLYRKWEREGGPTKTAPAITSITALSVKQPWAQMIIFHGKIAENRTWPTPYRGPLVIHASKQPEPRNETYTWGLYDEFVRGQRAPYPPPVSVLLGIVDLVGCDEAMHTEWDMPGQFHFRLANPRPFPKPLFFPRGQLGLYQITDRDILEQVRTIL